MENRYDFLTDILTSASLSSVTRRISHLLHRSVYRYSLHFKSLMGREGGGVGRIHGRGGGRVYCGGERRSNKATSSKYDKVSVTN